MLMIHLFAPAGRPYPPGRGDGQQCAQAIHSQARAPVWGTSGVVSVIFCRLKNTAIHLSELRY